MTNQVIIKTLKKAAICFKEKANEIITRLNIPWKFKMPDDDSQWGVPVVSYSEKEITIDWTNVSTLELTACDSEGNQVTVVVIGFIKDATEED